MCYTCGQALHEDKKAEIADRKSKELADAKTYAQEVNAKCSDVILSLAEIGDINGKPTTFYDNAKEAYEHRSNVDNLKKTLEGPMDQLNARDGESELFYVPES